MEFTLKDYQTDAVEFVLSDLQDAKRDWVRGKKVSSLSLTAPTGAGKTVMAAAVIEALFYGAPDFDFDPDPTAVVTWFSDDPNLNEQTRNRLFAASDKFTPGDLIPIKHPFSRRFLDPGKVYFLNTQRLSASSLLTRGHEETPALTLFDRQAAPDLQDYTIWETITNTIKNSDRTLYLVLDEAHRGFNSRVSRDMPTIVRRLVAGHSGYPAMPIVWGISATIRRFEEAMRSADENQTRHQFRPVIVDPGRVQESGLIKDVVSVKIPDESGLFDTALVSQGARELVASTERWADYAAKQQIEPIIPLMVLQVPNKPSTDTGEWADQIGLSLDAIADEFPGFAPHMVRNVFGEGQTERFGGWEVEYVEPQRVEDKKSVRVLVAKDAISTGWDCPRAEVLVSFRPATDPDHITQLLGRMVRNPLARRVPGDERYNAVECILPFFDKKTAANVVKYLTGNLEEMPGPSKKVLIDGRPVFANPNIGEEVWSVFDALPTQTLPKRHAKPVRRLAALAHALAADGVRENALAEAEREMRLVLDAAAIRHPDLLDREADDVTTINVKEIAGQMGTEKVKYRDLTLRADDRAIRSQFVTAKKAFGADIAQSYIDQLAEDDEETGDDGLRDAYIKVLALASIKEVREKVDAEATALADKWFDEHRVAIKGLPDARRDVYEEIRGMTLVPKLGEMARPTSRMEEFAGRKPEDNELDLEIVAPLAPLHLMSDDGVDGKYPGMFPLSSLNSWEQRVVRTELERPGAVGWYRNPPRSAGDSFAIPYKDDAGDWRGLYPDFIFFNDVDGEIRPSIVDPHWHELPNTSAKLKAFAKFAEDHDDAFHRIEAVSELETGVMYVLDMTIPMVREAIMNEDRPPVEFYRDLGVRFDDALTGNSRHSR